MTDTSGRLTPAKRSPLVGGLVLGLLVAAGACQDQPYRACDTGLVCQLGYECSPKGDFCALLNGCGNGRIDPDEVCDDGNRVSGDGCDQSCKSDERCGNGVRDLRETCDDENPMSGDGCSQNCWLENCGNGKPDPWEICDDGNSVASDGCSPDCLSDETCGNRHVDIARNESCDDGNTEDGDGCSSDCLDENCGNGVVDIGEHCDDGNTENDDNCSADCRSDETCGNGIVDSSVGEHCDDGNTTNGDGCNADCRRSTCGNGAIEPGEACDDGNTATGDGCSADCLYDERCGNGMLDPGEMCDPGSGELCSADCASDLRCWNRYNDVEEGEHCDDGMETPYCNIDCTRVRCGDRVVNEAAGEFCDNGAVHVATCDADCTIPACGDLSVNAAAGEECDDGNLVNTDDCTASCKIASCTDGLQNADETDVDCGGGCGATCEMLASCSTSQDCAAPGVCLAGTCVPDASRLATGGEHTCALLDTGAVRCWGDGAFGQLGYGNTSDIGDDETPASAGDVPVGGSVVQIAAGSRHTCALLDTGAVRCWGDGAVGRLGYANTNDIGDDETPASAGDVPVGGSVVQIAAGGSHTCALLDTGAVRCWGDGSLGRLGYTNADDIGDDEPPVSAGDVPVGGSVVQIAAGQGHTCALLDTGAIRCWGLGLVGLLGYGNTGNIGDDETPASAGDVPVGGSVVQIAAGDLHTCALLDTGAVRCWGYEDSGRLGYATNTGNIGDDETPASAGDVPVGGSVVQVAVGALHTCALLDTGSVRCWGDGNFGQLGYANTDDIGDDETPASAGDVPVGGSVVQITAGFLHACALLDTGAVRCWGLGAAGRLGYANQDAIGDDETPASAGDVPVDGTGVQIAAGGSHTCALLDTGAVRCWGAGGFGQLGYANTSNIGDDETPASAGDVPVGGSVVRIAASDLYSCALLNTGAVRCWGAGGFGQLGYGNTSNIGDDETPASAGDVPVGGSAVQLAAGGAHTCILLDTGAVRCWGLGAAGQLGYANTSNIGDDETPALAGDVSVGGSAVQITTGLNHTCALLDTGSVRCWGSGISGQLGNANPLPIGDDETPASAGDVPVGGSVVQIAASGSHTCALLDTGSVRCWGDGLFGRLGYANTNTIGDNETPASAGDVPVGGTVIQIAAGYSHTCALLDTGAVRCWGAGASGRLGYANTNNIGDDETPASAGDVPVGGTVVQIAAGGGHTCALLDTGAVRCWGNGASGRLGYANTSNIGDNEPPASAGDVPYQYLVAAPLALRALSALGPASGIAACPIPTEHVH